MRVLFINENIGGHATVHHHLRSALADHPEVDARFLDVPPPGLPRRLASAPIPGLARLDADLQPLRSQLAVSAWVRHRLGKIVDDVDVVHLYTQNAGLLCTSLLRRTPTVVSLDTTNARNAYRLPYRKPTRLTPLAVPLSMAAERRVFRAARTVIANSQWARDSLVGDYGLPPEKIVLLPFGITAPPEPLLARARPESGCRRPTIVFVGRQFERKGGPVLVEAWRRSVADRADLLLVTQEPIPAEPGITVVDDLRPGEDRLWTLLAGSALLAFPSTIDQAPNAVIEAMAAGLPVITVANAAMAEMVVHDETGLHVPGDDVDALGAALTTLVDRPDLRARMGAAGRRRFEAHYDARASTDALIDVLRRSIDGTGGHDDRTEPS